MNKKTKMRLLGTAMLGLSTVFGGCASHSAIGPAIQQDMDEGVRMKSPVAPHQGALDAIAYCFKKMYPDERIMVLSFTESTGKVSESFGSYLPLEPKAPFETILIKAGFPIVSRGRYYEAAIRERNGMLNNIIDEPYKQKMERATLCLEGAVSGLEFATRSDALAVGVGSIGLTLDRSAGKMSIDLKLIDMETSESTGATRVDVSFKSLEGGPGLQDYGILSLGSGDLFKIGFEGGRTPSLSDVQCAGIAKAAYKVFGSFVQEYLPICNYFIGKEFDKKAFEMLRRGHGLPEVGTKLNAEKTIVPKMPEVQ